MRFAIIKEHRKSQSIGGIADYLPANYRIVHMSPADGILIGGTDDHGWTLDGYVIPRLASGMIIAQEVWPMFVGRNENYPVQMEITPEVMSKVTDER